MHDLYIDIETYNGSVSLPDCGVYKYAESPDADVLLFGYSIDGDPVQVADLTAGDEIPGEVLSALSDPSVTKWAHNASFERVFLSIWLSRHHPEYFKSYGAEDDTVSSYLNPEGWKCSMVWCAYMGLPFSLEQAGAVLKISEQKLSEGKDLVRYFCCPCSPTKANGGRTRNLPGHDPDRYRRFIDYNRRDVEAEMGIIRKLRKYPVPENIWREYWLSEQINDRGILIDGDLVKSAISIDGKIRTGLLERMKALTGLETPTSVTQLKGWLSSKGITADSLDKKAVADLLKDAPPDVAEVLTLRQMTSKSSIKKYEKMAMTVCADGRIRGLYQFYGANRTGRWAGRHVQMQNLRQNHLPDLAEARELVRRGDIGMLETLYDDVPDVLSQLLRTAFVPKPGYSFLVSDFSAVEARVLSAIAGEVWRMDVFKHGGDIYCASASEMFGVPVEKHGRNSHLRQKGKIAELALGYGGSVGALKSMGALEQGLEESELQPLVDAWRTANPNIVSLWWDMDECVKQTVRTHLDTRTHGIGFTFKGNLLFMILPSGRRLCYPSPRLEPNQYGGESVTYLGLDQAKKWTRLESYGPKFVENAVQAVSRDLLMEAMFRLSDKLICGHVHDELIIEAPPGTVVDEVTSVMGQTPEWISGLLLRADGYECPDFYMKD
ncbi:MAG: DNA polymerase [Lachnospiraceae bacterium]|nr:DNA polymerase [Lachnospiraceae bacterium]